MSSSEEDADKTRRRVEESWVNTKDHVDGITVGTVIEYDDWQWGVITEVADDHEPPKFGFVLVDDLDDAIVSVLESAWGCKEHYDGVKQFRWSEHEYWTDIEYVTDDEIWTVLGPVHPDARDDEAEVKASA